MNYKRIPKIYSVLEIVVVINYKLKTILLGLIVIAAFTGFIFYPEHIEGNIGILLIAITTSIIELKENHKSLPKYYLIIRYINILLFVIALVLTLLNR